MKSPGYRTIVCFLVLLISTACRFPDGQLIADPPSGQPTGTTVTWTVQTDNPDPLEFRFEAGRLDEPLRVVYDFRQDNVFSWTPLEEGVYHIVAKARDKITGLMTTTEDYYWVQPRVSEAPLVTATDHPLVALYSAPSCDAGNFMRVIYGDVDGYQLYATNCKPCIPGQSMNFYIGGLQPETTHVLVHQILKPDGSLVETGPERYFQAGSPEVTVPPAVVRDLPDQTSSLLENIVLFSPVLGSLIAEPFPFAMDLGGRLRWYYHSSMEPSLMRPVAGGTFLMQENDGMILREVDLPGHVVRETTVERINEQLRAMGLEPVTALHHEARRLPNGYTGVLAYAERMLENVQGEGPVDILGDCILILDENWQVVWVWDAFDHLDVSRQAVLGETCTPGDHGCPATLLLGDIANDWLHSNAIAYSPDDGNLILSMRHQDWIIKIDYRNGLGTGDILWRLGRDGDFTLAEQDPFLWFSHQHDPNFVKPDQITLYDNGNTRCALDPDQCFSRGQTYTIDEAAKTASLDLNVDLGNFSFALGSAQPLMNGNFHFSSGAQFTSSHMLSTADEVTPDGVPSYSLEVWIPLYRSFRMRDLYTPPLTDPDTGG